MTPLKMMELTLWKTWQRVKLHEWDEECDFYTEVRDLYTSSEFQVFGYDHNEELEALSDEKKDISGKMIGKSFHEDSTRG